MSAELQTLVKSPGAGKEQSLTPAKPGVLQRKCACGSSHGVSGECSDCRDKHLTLQRYSVDRAAPSSLLNSTDRESRSSSSLIKPSVSTASAFNFDRVQVHSRASHKVQTKLAVSEPGDQFEQEADRAAAQVMGSLEPAATIPQPSALSDTQSLVQRMPEPTATQRAEASPASLIVDDEADQIGPGQMKKTDFLDRLQTAVCSAADAELTAVGRTAQGCPYIEKWIGYYRTRDSQYLERAIQRYAPGAAAATTAQDYIPVITERVRRAVAVWAKTGEITGIPEGASATPPEAGASEAGKTTGDASVGLQFKEAAGGAKSADNPAAIRAQLDGGRSLDNSVRSKMESAFGYDFSRVRVHTDTKAAGISSGLNARAFTIGSDVAFATGEYRPGTLVGDALIAHELAHVVQQKGAASEPMTKGGGEYNGLEEDADRSAVGAVVAMWGGAKSGMANIAENAMPRLKSGLRLQRCAGIVTGTLSPSDFIFKVIIPLKGRGPGGWKVACHSPFFVAYTGAERQKWNLTCDYEVGVPIRNIDGDIPDDLAQARALLASRLAAEVVLQTFHNSPLAPPKAAFCKTYEEVMHYNFSKDELVSIKGSRVNKAHKYCP